MSATPRLEVVPIRLGDRKILAVPPILTSARGMLLDMRLDDLDNLHEAPPWDLDPFATDELPYAAPQKEWLPRIYDRARFDPEWYAKWAPACPDGNPQRMCEIVGFRLKALDYLQLRVVLRERDHGVCQAIIEEHDDVVFVHALACFDPDPAPSPTGKRRRAPKPTRPSEMDCPCNVGLAAPLGERIVVGYETDEPLSLFIPGDLTHPSEYVPRPPGVLLSDEFRHPILDAHHNRPPATGDHPDTDHPDTDIPF